MFPSIALALAAMLLSGCSRATPEQTVIDEAAQALGGRGRIGAAKSLVVTGSGLLGNLGQDMRPESTGQTFTLSDLTRRIDLGTGRARTEFTRTPDFVYFQGPAPQRHVAAIDGRVGYNVGANGAATRLSDAVAGDRRVEFYHHPLTVFRLAAASGVTLVNARDEDGQRLVDINSGDGVAVTLALDPATHLPARVVSKASHPNLGDVIVETRFANYQTVGGLQLPAHLLTTIDGARTADLRLSSQTLDQDVADLEAPAAVTAAAAPTPAAPTVTAEVVAPGVWWLAGQSHHSALLEFTDHLLLIEAPQSEARTLAVIAKARELRPNKPLRQVVNSHHHFDHSAGIRAAIAEGLEVITHTGNREYIELVARKPFTIVPDTLAKGPQEATVTAVEQEMTIADQSMTVVLYPIDGNPHGDTMLMAYLPKQRILIQADAFSPGSPYQPYAANLIDNVQRRKLHIDRLVSLHGTIVPFAELLKTQTPTQ